MKKRFIFLICCTFFLLYSSFAWSCHIDLSSFQTNSGITLIPGEIYDGEAAFFEEIIGSNENVILKNDAFNIPSNAGDLIFQYIFISDTGGNDHLRATINSTNLIDIYTTKTGWYSMDLSPYQGQMVSLSFELLTHNSPVESKAIISNLDIIPVPSPTSMFLLASGLIGLVIRHRRPRLK